MRIMEKDIRFVIVTFVEENNAPGIVASNWIKEDGNTCFYPNVRTEEMKEKLLRKMAAPNEMWQEYKIKILKGYETYGDARLHLRKAEDTSNLDSDEDLKKRKRKRKINVYLPEDSEDSSNEQDSQQPYTKKKGNLSKYPSPPRPKAAKSLNSEDSPNKQDHQQTSTKKKVYFSPPRPKAAKSLNSEDSPNKQDHQQTSTKKKVDFSPPRPKAAESLNSDKMDVHSTARRSPSPTVMFSGPSASLSRAHPSVESPAVPSQPKMCPSDCATSNKQLAIQQSHLIQMVTDLSKQVSEIIRKVDLIVGRPEEALTPRRPDPLSLPQFLTNLPVNDDDSFCHLNEQVKNSDNKQAMIQFLAGIGGKNIRSFATNMLRRILLDEVAEQYSLTGKKMKNSNKKSFLDTEISKLIFQICKKVHGTTDDNLKEIISDWLNQAKVRLSRRAERKNKDLA